MRACQFVKGNLHVGDGGVQTEHFKPLRIGGFSRVNGTRIDQDYPTRRREMLCALVCERLKTALDKTDHIVIVTVTWKCMIDEKTPQQFYVKPGIMPGPSPFLFLHDASRAPF